VNTTWVNLIGAQVKHDGRKYPGRYFEAGPSTGSGGEPLILLHGGGGYAENFTRNIMVYGRYFHTFAIDAAWFGLGPMPPFQDDIMAVWLDQLIDFMDWKGFDSAHVEGQSMGGWTAMALAREHPERVRRLVLTTPTGFSLPIPEMERRPPPAAPAGGPPRGAAVNDAALQSPTFENVQRRMAGLVADPTRIPEELVRIRMKIYGRPQTAEGMLKAGAAYREARLGGESPASKHFLGEKELAQIKAETLVYWGEQNVTPPAVGEALARAIPNARYYCNPDTGHWAQWEHADVHNKHVLRFLTGDETLDPPSWEEC
jgi:pimeloyl-ACP methyl ester carboxylesterase